MAARQANLEHLKLYFNVGAYVSANSRDGAWNIAAIETIFDAAVAGIARVAGGQIWMALRRTSGAVSTARTRTATRSPATA